MHWSIGVMKYWNDGETGKIIAIIALVVGLNVGDLSHAAQPAKVRISCSSRSNSNTPFQIALNKGFFAEEGWDVEMIQVNPRLGATALLNGDIDFTTTLPFDLTLQTEGFRALAGPKDVEIALPTSGIAVANRLLQQNPQHVRRAVRALMKAHRYVFENKKDVVPQLIRYLDQTPEVAERSYDLLLISLSRNGEIADHEWDLLTEKKQPVDEVRDFTLLREVHKELRTC